MLGAPLLRAARRGALNMHGSLLPKFRGRAPVNWAILKGAHECGATLHYMVERADAGEIVDQLAVPILAGRRRARGVRQGDGGRRDRAGALAPGADRRHRAAAAAADRAGPVLRAAAPGGRAHRLAAPGARDPQPGARGGAAIPRGLRAGRWRALGHPPHAPRPARADPAAGAPRLVGRRRRMLRGLRRRRAAAPAGGGDPARPAGADRAGGDPGRSARCR